MMSLRKRVQLVSEFNKKRDEDLNNIIDDIRLKYDIVDDDVIRWNVALEIVTTRKIGQAMGVKL